MPQTSQNSQNIIQNSQIMNQNLIMPQNSQNTPKNSQMSPKPSFSTKLANAFLSAYLKDNTVSARRASMLLDALIFYKHASGQVGTKTVSSSLLMLSSDRMSDFIADFRCDNTGVQVMLGMPVEINDEALDFVLGFIHGDKFDEIRAELILDQIFICASFLKVDDLVDIIKKKQE